jgi:hypothetical protein
MGQPWETAPCFTFIADPTRDGRTARSAGIAGNACVSYARVGLGVAAGTRKEQRGLTLLGESELGQAGSYENCVETPVNQTAATSTVLKPTLSYSG